MTPDSTSRFRLKAEHFQFRLLQQGYTFGQERTAVLSRKKKNSIAYSPLKGIARSCPDSAETNCSEASQQAHPNLPTCWSAADWEAYANSPFNGACPRVHRCCMN